jgi:outer membrane protein, multidrug efflux system
MAILSGCTVGPEYRAPPADVTGATATMGSFPAQSGAGFIEAELPDQWWALYEDARLNELVVQALAANVDLRVAEANIRRANAIVQQAKAARTPITTLAGGAGYAKDGIPTPGPSTFVYSVAGSVAYPVDLFGGISRGIQAAQYGEEAVIAARDETRVVVAAGVTRSYTAACSANHSYSAAVNVLDIQRRTLSTTERLFKGGRATAFDVARSRAAVDQGSALLPVFLATRQAALYQLGALLGRAPQNFPQEVERCESPPTLATPLPIGNGATLLRRRPDIREAERRLAAATATIGVSVAQLYPQITLGGSASSVAPLSLSASEASLAFSIGPLVTWSFPNQRVVRAKIAQAGAVADEAAAVFDATVIEALRETDSALSVYARQLEAVSDLERARADAAVANDQAHRLYLFGRTEFINVLTADSALASADAALAQSQALLVDDQVAVFQTLGGGWQPHTSH